MSQTCGRNQYTPGSPPRTTMHFATIQMDFTDFTPVIHSHCLVIVCMFSGWSEWYLTGPANGTTVVVKLITGIITYFGIHLWIKSDQGIHFTGEINHLLAKTGIDIKVSYPILSLITRANRN